MGKLTPRLSACATPAVSNRPRAATRVVPLVAWLAACAGLAGTPVVHAAAPAKPASPAKAESPVPDGAGGPSNRPGSAAPAPAPRPAEKDEAVPPSRHVGEDELVAFVKARAELFSIRGRGVDPFGQLQDPDAKPVVKASTPKVTRRIAPVQATPFSDIVKLLKVTTVMPKERQFLIGTRSIKQGDEIQLTYRGKNLRVEVSAVSARQIALRNVESDETATLPLNVLPPGMTNGTRGITAPGMAPLSADAPIDLDPNMPSPSLKPAIPPSS